MSKLEGSVSSSHDAVAARSAVEVRADVGKE